MVDEEVSRGRGDMPNTVARRRLITLDVLRSSVSDWDFGLTIKRDGFQG